MFHDEETRDFFIMKSKELLKKSKKNDVAYDIVLDYTKTYNSPMIKMAYIDRVKFDKIAEIENIDRRTVSKKIDAEIRNYFACWFKDYYYFLYKHFNNK